MTKPLKLTFIADTHYYAPCLGTSGKAYARRSGADQKCLAETGAILDAAFQKIRESDTDAVMLVGDLTNDGERASHLELIQKLKALQAHKPIYVTVATHDWCCDQNARRYSGDCVFRDVDTVHHTQLREMYRDFGLCSASDEFITHLGLSSYRVELSEDVVLLALNDDQNGKGKAGFAPDHLEWILNHIRSDSAAGKTVIAMEHHLLFPHISKLATRRACCGDSEMLLRLFADAGLRVMFVGHSHIQRIDRYVSPRGNALYEVNIGSLCGYPAPMVQVEIDAQDIRIHTERLEEFTYNGSLCTQAYFKAHAQDVIFRILHSAQHDNTDDYIQNAAELGIGRKTALRLHPILKYTARLTDTATVGSVGKVLNRLTCGKGLDRRLLQQNADVPIREVVSAFIFSALDGTPELHFQREGLRALLCRVFNLPGLIAHTLGLPAENQTVRQICLTLLAILTGGEGDNNTITIKRF